MVFRTHHVLLLGVATALAFFLWFSGIDGEIQRYLEANQTLFWNKFWRVVGDLGLGRVQMLGCLSVATVLTWKTLPRAVRPPVWQLPVWLFMGALMTLVRLYLLRITPPQHQLKHKAFKMIWNPIKALKYAYHFVWMLPKHARAWVMTIPIMFGAGLVGILMKASFGRPRPKAFLWEEYGHLYWPDPFTLDRLMWSFPSGHTITTFALVAMMTRLYPKWAWAWVLGASFISFARVAAVTPHYLGDVVMGAVVGYAVGSWLVKQYKILS